MGELLPHRQPDDLGVHRVQVGQCGIEPLPQLEVDAAVTEVPTVDFGGE